MNQLLKPLIQSKKFSNNNRIVSSKTTAMEKLLIIRAGIWEDQIIRVQKQTKLILEPSPDFLVIEPSLKTNYPVKKNSKFSRHQYNSLAISVDHQDLISSSLNWHVSLLIELAGTYHFTCSSNGELVWAAYIVVDPELKIPLNSIKCQTVLTKCLGQFSDWRSRLGAIKEAKYNMVHLTPIQELGSSDSSYSIRNQLKVDSRYKASLNDIKKEIDYMDKKWNILTVTDIVLNHTANDSSWIKEHPECAYNLENSPHLRPAFLLDTAFIWLQQDLLAGHLIGTDKLSHLIETEMDVQKIGVLLKSFYVPQLRIHEFFTVDVIESVKNYDKLDRSMGLKIEYSYTRNGARVLSMGDDISSPQELQELLTAQNIEKRKEISNLLNYAIDNALNAIRFERFDPNGPYFKQPITPEAPLVAPYFTHQELEQFKISQVEASMFKSGHLFMAHNGWVMGSSEITDFTNPDSQVFLKRELIAWGDCIKLRYGSGPQEVPYLWDHMKKYVESQAKIFHGFRIDNCHSTPLHVAEFVVDVARSVKQDIYIMAELFTSSESADNVFVNKLGLTSLIRESMSASNPRELGRLVYRFGGAPVGAFYAQGVEPLKPGVAHAIFFDQTHDNESPINTRSVFDVAATTAIINMANCATGSNRGLDELVPHHINVVTEQRLYPTKVDENCGILPLRRMLNGLLQNKLSQGFSEIFVDQLNDEVIAVTRHNPVDGRSVVLVARTAFSKEPKPCNIPAIPIQGKISRVLFESQCYGDPNKFLPDETYINGLSNFRTKLFSQNCSASECKLARIDTFEGEDRAELVFNEYQFLPSSVIAIEICLSERQTEALRILTQWQVNLNEFDLTTSDLNYILFRCTEEDGLEPYALPDFCKFTYAGLYGLMYYLKTVRDNQDQAHPLAMNLRQGNWLSDYIVSRLSRRKSTKPLGDHLNFALQQVNLLPRGMIPKYFDFIVTKVYNSVIEAIYSPLSVFVSKGPKLVKLLTLSSYALLGECESASLPPVNESKLTYVPSLAAGLPHFASGFMRNWGRDTFIAMRGLLLIPGRFTEARCIILSYARTLHHGLIPNLLDGGTNSRFNCRDAIWWWLYSIREYTTMAPNGSEILRCKVKRLHKPRAVIPQRKKSTAQMMNGNSTAATAFGGEPAAAGNYLFDIIQEAMSSHFEGVEFVEERAGKQLDEHMKLEGFTVSYGVDRDTGFVFGGNRWNCGTWMDKMGSSEKAGTKGLPASPRDGSAVEIVGLCKAVVSWLDEMFRNGRLYPYDGVECLYDNTITLKWTWKKWSSMIKANFEKYFYIPTTETVGALATSPTVDDCKELNPDLINRRGIYKDTLNASIKWQDYQLRPNFLVAMVVAPELFDREHAKQALSLVKENLCGPLGMRTLDPADWNYSGIYDNGDDSENKKTAHGYNYHQGPEWLWLTGYYIRASSKFLGSSERSHHLQILSNFYSSLTGTPWLGLPELTNENGLFCRDSCPIQAWSVATALEALHESVRSSA